MSIIEAIILGITQGLTEFIPISSSGHLIFMRHILGVFGNDLAFDVALHIGTILALVAVFYKDIWELFLGLLGKNDKRKLALLLIIATVPAVISGVLLEKAAESTFRSVRLVAVDMIIAAFFILWAESFAKKRKNRTKLENTKTKQAIIIGLAQAAAVVPGISRSGATITAGLFAGMDRVAATRFSFLLAIPITTGAILKVLADGGGLAQGNDQTGLVVVGIVSAFLSGLFAIKFLLNYLAKHSLSVFAYYRIAVGLAAIAIVTIR